MSFLTQSKLAQDPQLHERITACAGSLKIDNPSVWASASMWHVASLPGWAQAYSGAEGEQPGADESAITDEMILAAVQSLLASSPA